MDRRNVDPVVHGTPGGAQGRSSWEGGAQKVQRPKGVLRRRPVRKKRPAKRVFFLVFPLRLDDSSGSGLTQCSPNRKREGVYRQWLISQSKLYVDRRRSSRAWDVGRGARAIQLGGGGAEGAARRRRAAPKAQYRPKAGKKKKTREAGLFFLVPPSFQ